MSAERTWLMQTGAHVTLPHLQLRRVLIHLGLDADDRSACALFLSIFYMLYTHDISSHKLKQWKLDAFVGNFNQNLLIEVTRPARALIDDVWKPPIQHAATETVCHHRRLGCWREIKFYIDALIQGYWLSEAAHPYYTLVPNFDIDFASPKKTFSIDTDSATVGSILSAF